MKKILVVLGIVFLVLIAICAWFLVGQNVWRTWHDNRIIAEIKAENKAIDDLYKNDKNGGDTPEVTLALFVEALKRGDIESAAGYFVPEKRKKMRNDLTASLEKRGVDAITNDLKIQKTKHCLDYQPECDMSYYDQSINVWYKTTFIQNKYSQKWLIESL